MQKKKRFEFKSLVLKRAKTSHTRKNKQGTVFILNILQEDSFFEVNGVASEIWLSLNGRKNMKAITIKLAKKYGTSERRLESDAKPFIQKLIKNGLAEHV